MLLEYDTTVNMSIFYGNVDHASCNWQKATKLTQSALIQLPASSKLILFQAELDRVIGMSHAEDPVKRKMEQGLAFNSAEFISSDPLILELPSPHMHTSSRFGIITHGNIYTMIMKQCMAMPAAADSHCTIHIDHQFTICCTGDHTADGIL